VYHFVLSWREDESPTDSQAFEAVNATLTALKMHENQWVAGLHRNTNNVHAHVAVNRVNPDTYKAVSVFRDWFVLDRTCREIELKQGWLHDKGSHRIEVADGGQPQIVRNGRERSDDSPSSPTTKARDYEAWNGRKSFQRWIADEPAQSLRRLLEQPHPTWEAVHKTLAAFELEYRPKGSGAVIVDLTEPDKLHAKASHFGRFGSRGNLETRLGPYEGPTGARTLGSPKSYRVTIGNGAHRHDVQEIRLRDRFELAHAQHQIQQKAVTPASVGQRGGKGAGHAELPPLDQTVRGSSGRVDQSASPAVVAIKPTASQQHLDQQLQERRRPRAQTAGHGPGSWRSWLVRQAHAGDHDASEDLLQLRRGFPRRRLQEQTLLATELTVGRLPNDNVILKSLAAIGNVSGVNFLEKGRAIFCDQGSRVVFHSLEDNHIKAGLALAGDRWDGGIYVLGTDRFRRSVTALAGEVGIRVRGAALWQEHRLGLGELSKCSGKAIVESNLIAGRQHTGRVVTASIESVDKGTVILDVGRELLILRTNAPSAFDLKHKTGQWVQAYVSAEQRDNVSWRFSDLERKGPERFRGL